MEVTINGDRVTVREGEFVHMPRTCRTERV
jgi:quercetin dioxygenase-like cupin family protein